jgi:Tfp pilus assembly protein PilV
MNACARGKPQHRRGVILLVALAAMVIVTAIAAAATSATLRTRQSRKTERDRIQLNLLCDAGVMRVRDRWNRSEDYRSFSDRARSLESHHHPGIQGGRDSSSRCPGAH